MHSRDFQSIDDGCGVAVIPAPVSGFCEEQAQAGITGAGSSIEPEEEEDKGTTKLRLHADSNPIPAS
ncbi:hypothetical protein NEUTE2DRAFT_129998 [Neurospora tetrasperma FGSC 2509]|nr:hypothetical protein NEUTE2DRAFT_129998 [Neurospora tetrasperma FGSC 2509]